ASLGLAVSCFFHPYRTTQSEYSSTHLPGEGVHDEAQRERKRERPIDEFGLLGARNHLPRLPAGLPEELEPVAHVKQKRCGLQFLSPTIGHLTLARIIEVQNPVAK